MSDLCELLVIRHAETDMAGTFCGHSNPAVNARGFEQIEQLLEALKDNSIDAIYTSDLQRSVSTAEVLAMRFDLKPIQTPTLREVSFGEWEGVSWDNIEARDPVFARRWVEEFPALCAPGGESFESFRTRVIAITQELRSLPLRRIAVVTHAGVMRVILKELCGVSEQETWAITKPYCSFFEYTASGEQAAIA